MELNNYFKACSKVLLKKICELSKDKNLVNIYEKYDQKLNVSVDVDFTWSVISAALLLSENLWQNESAYKNISDESIENILDKLSDGKLHVKGDPVIENNCLLDEKNKVANAININEIQNTYNPDDNEMILYRMSKRKELKNLDYFDRSSIEFLDNIFEGNVYGANDLLLTDGRIDYRKFIVRVRHALAHSNYEILDNGLIRLYHFNRNEKRLDFNVVLNKKTIVTILDELNEWFYKSGTKFIQEWNVYHNQHAFKSNKEINEEEVVEQLLKYKMFTLDDCYEILTGAKSDKNYKNSDAADKLNIIYNCFLHRITPVCSYGIIVNEILYGNDNGLIDEEYDEKLGLYNYFNSELFTVNMDTNSEELNKHTLELYLFALLNCSLLNEVNINNNEINTIIDFSKMQIREEDYDNAILGKSKLVTDLNNQILKAKKDIENANQVLHNKMAIYHKNYGIENDYFVNKLPAEIYDVISNKSNLIIELNNLYQTLQVADLINISNYILTHLRNCLAHGYINIIGEVDLNNILNTKIEFSDYEPEDKSKLTFKGTIRLMDLLEILTSEKYINSVMKESVKIKQR